MIKIFKLLVLCMVFYTGMFFGEIISNIKQQRKELAKDPSGQYHNICKSQIMGKVHGKPCVLCIKKWSIEHPDGLTEEERIVKYCEKIRGKPITEFTEAELTDCVLMFLQ